MERHVVICRCEAVSLEQIEAAMAEGLHTPIEIKARTRSGMGICQGRTCRGLLEELLVAYGKADASTVVPLSCRPPLRPVLLEHLAAIPQQSVK